MSETPPDTPNDRKSPLQAVLDHPDVVCVVLHDLSAASVPAYRAAALTDLEDEGEIAAERFEPTPEAALTHLIRLLAGPEVQP